MLREPQRERMRGPGQPREGGSRKGLTFLLSPETEVGACLVRRGQDRSRLWEQQCVRGWRQKRAPCGPRLPTARSELPGNLRRRQHDQASVSERCPDGSRRVAWI